jgi:hypothetical protein
MPTAGSFQDPGTLCVGIRCGLLELRATPLRSLAVTFDQPLERSASAGGAAPFAQFLGLLCAAACEHLALLADGVFQAAEEDLVGAYTVGVHANLRALVEIPTVHGLVAFELGKLRLTFLDLTLALSHGECQMLFAPVAGVPGTLQPA